MRMWRINWKGDCPALTLAHLTAFRQALIDAFGWTPLGAGAAQTSGSKRVAFAAFDDAFFGCHFNGTRLLITCWIVGQNLAPLKALVLSHFPWNGIVVTLGEDDMGDP